MKEPEYNIGDTVWTMYNNKAICCIVTDEIRVQRKSITVDTMMELNSIKANPSTIINKMSVNNEVFYRLSQLPTDVTECNLCPIEAGFYGHQLFDSKQKLLESL